MTPDGTPVIGADEYDNLLLNTGHGTLGWTMACGSGRVLADLVSGRRPEIDTEGLGIGRYVEQDEAGQGGGVKPGQSALASRPTCQGMLSGFPERIRSRLRAAS